MRRTVDVLQTPFVRETLYEHMVNIVSSRFRHGPKTEERAVDDAMMKVISDKNTLRCPFISWITAALLCRLQVSMIPGTAGRWDGFMFDLNPKLLTHPEQVKVLRFALKPHLEFLKTLDEVLEESSGESSKTA